MKSATFKLLFLILSFYLSSNAFAQKDFITVTGISESVKIDPSQLNHTTLKAIGHDNKEHIYTGVLLADILQKAGINLGNKRESTSSYLIFRAKDNYKSIFSLAEIDPLFSKHSILIADKTDDKNLDPSDEPFQVIVPGDKIQTRWVRQLVSIEFVQVK